MKKATLFGVALLVLSVAAQRGFAEEAKPLHEHPTLVQMLFRNNELRRQMGLRPHRISPELTKAAQDHANYMANTGVFSHYANGGPFARAIRYRFLGGVRENIAMGQGNVTHVFSTWRNSGGHWASIVSNTTDAGFGYALGPGGTPYWVAVYGTPPAPAPAAEEGTTPAATAPASTTTYTSSSNSGRRLIFRRR
jgi:cysteine-rich secretory family protein